MAPANIGQAAGSRENQPYAVAETIGVGWWLDRGSVTVGTRPVPQVYDTASRRHAVPHAPPERCSSGKCDSEARASFASVMEQISEADHFIR
jgi:hypothetical protein